MGTNSAPLVTDFCLFCYEKKKKEKDFVMSLSNYTQAHIIEAFNSTSRYLDTLVNIDNLNFKEMIT